MINFFGPINHLGTGVHTYNLAKAVSKVVGHVNVCLFTPFGQVQFEDFHVAQWLMNRLKFSQLDPSVMIFDHSFMAQFAGDPRIGFCVFETTAIPPLSLRLLEQCDHVFTPSHWGVSVLKGYGLHEIYRVPEGFDHEIFMPLFEDTKRRPFTFVHIGKWELRKGSAQVIEAFARGMEGLEAVLVMHCQNPFLTDYSDLNAVLDQWGFVRSLGGNTYRRLGTELRIIFTSKTDDARGVASLYHSADCGVFPSRGEGWGLPIMECIASGVPAISGRWTAMGDYITAEYPEDLVLSTYREEPASDGRWFRPETHGMWFVPDTDELIARMRWAHANARMLRSSPQWRDYIEKFSKHTWDQAGRVFVETLGTIGVTA